MAKRFHFDDENDEIFDDEIIHNYSKFEEKTASHNDKMKDACVFDDNNSTKSEGKNAMSKKKKKFKWKWWHYLMIVLLVLVIAFSVYIFSTSRNDGPVLGSRADGVVEIDDQFKKETVESMTNKYPEIKKFNLTTIGKQVKMYIEFKDDMSTKKAKSIAEEAVLKLDKLVGRPKKDGGKYSELFGTINNIPQYEVDLILVSQNNKDFPIFGTKHNQSDEFSYTLASIKDQDSYKKAQETLKEKNN